MSLTKKLGDDPRDHATIHTLEGVLGQTVDPKNPLTPGQLFDLMEIMLTDLHLRKVGGEFWVETCHDVMNCAKVATEINCLAMIIAKLPELDEKNKATLEAMLELTINESKDLRRKLVPTVNLLKEMPCPGETLH